MLARLTEHERRLERLETRQKMTEATVAELTEAVTSLTTAFNTFATDVNQTIADILAHEAGGGTISGAELGPIKDSLATLTADVAAADAIVKADDPGKPVAAPTKAVYLRAGEAAVAGPWSPSGFETVPVAAVPAVPAVPANPETGAPETPEVAEVPAKPAEPLYYFAGDTAPGTTNGADAEWTPYTGPVQAVPAA